MATPHRFSTLFARLSSARSLEARFANLLSFMEYVGARKILKSQPEDRMDLELIGHASEEIRHALLLKRLALRLDPGVTSYRPEHLLGGEAGNAYMQAIDRAAEADLSPDAAVRGRQAFVNYLYTTLLVEERAKELYPLYAEHLAPLGQDAVARAILREEEGHLAAVLEGLLKEDPALAPRLARLRDAESAAFAAWLSRVEADVLRLAAA